MLTIKSSQGLRMFALLSVIATILDVSQPCIQLLDGWTRKSVSERAKLVKVVFVGKVVGLYPVDSMSQTYAAQFKIHRILKGEQIINDVLEMHPGPTVKVYGFGERRLCYSEVYIGEMHLVFMVIHPQTRSLVARYDDIFGATSPVTSENEHEILTALGWKEWSAWSSCSRSCGNGGRQGRSRKCAVQTCDGHNSEQRKCNFFNCYGIKNVGQYFSLQSERDLPKFQNTKSKTRIARHVTLQGPTALTMPISKVFKYYFPDEYSISITFRPVQYSDIYLVALYDGIGQLQFGIRLKSGFLTFETYDNHRQYSVDFNVQISLTKWHSITFSLQAKQITMYWDCEKVGTKSLSRRHSFAPKPSGTISLGKTFFRFDYRQKDIEIDELFFVPDVEAAKQQCNIPTFTGKTANRNHIEGSGMPDIENYEGSGSLSNYVDDKDEVKAEWSQWSPCSATCGKGVRVRVTLCSNIDDKPLDDDCQQILQKSQEKACYLRECPGRCPKPCANGGFCNSHSKCQCRRGYHGDECEKVRCLVPCFNGGKCIGPTICQCTTGYTGRQCGKPICNVPCQNGGTCIRPNVCRCPSGYQQPACTAACYPGCQNGGKCVGPGTCRCPRGFTGRRCEKAFCSRPCLNGGLCYASDRCSCSYGWHGSRCEKARCIRRCMNGGRCVRPNMCMCVGGTYGYYCQYGRRYHH